MAAANCEAVRLRRQHLREMLLRYLLISAASGSIPAVLNALFGHSSGKEFVRQALEGMCFAACIGALCYLVLPRIARPVLRMHPALRWLTLASVIIALSAIGCAIAMVILALAGAYSLAQYWPIYAQALKTCVLIALAFGISGFFHHVVIARFNRATADLKASDEAAEKLRQVALEARLSSLESRVQPHFLFNTLNSILALIREDPAAAEGMVERLAALLRFSLDANQSRLVPLSLEVKIVRDYLEIEQTRFGARLRFSIDVPAVLNGIEVPPMSLQTLVENSVKYAVSARREGATISVTARAHEAFATVEVVDDGPGVTTARLKPGHGLELLQSRMEGLFNGEARLEVESREGGGTRVAMRLPVPREMAGLEMRRESAEVPIGSAL